MRLAVRGSGRVALIAVAACVAACAERSREPTPVTIPTGASMRAAAESLHAAGLVRFPGLFRTYAKLRGSDRGIRPGTYLIPSGSGWGDVLATLRSGRGIMAVVTIPEGFTLAQIQPVLASKLSVPEESVTVAARDTALLQRLDLPTVSVEGYLFPDTYFFAPGTSARVAVSVMVHRFEQQWRPAWTARLDTLKATRHAVVTLASIVEREAKLPKERAVIAAVYWNRLRRGMLLQADPTVQYALPAHVNRVLNKHLRVQSPYNTYRQAGLPPGPIGSPGEASLQATLYPANVQYRYFVAMPDGHHEFRVSLAEHEQAVRIARRAWDAVREAKPNTQKPARRTGS
jgi:UPF0755 protein